jgi:hypothetical protein
LGIHQPAFNNTGIDLFGPYGIKIGRSVHKRWVALFTCGTIRAVHMEVVKSLSADSMINAMARFEALRGRPSLYWTDNGTNFVGARSELADCWASVDINELATRMASRGVRWRFNPPSAPHMGGVWEALVRSAKRALHFVLGDRDAIDEEIFATVIAHVTGLLNARPLTVLNDDPSCPEPLTPNHLLLGRANAIPPPGRFEEQEVSSRKKWRAAQAITDLFWARWQTEYSPTLLARRKWASGDRNLRKGDVVAVLDRKNARGHWQIGRVRRPVESADGVVRSAWVAVPKQDGQPGQPTALIELLRPAVKLALLEPVDDDGSPPTRPLDGPARADFAADEPALPSAPSDETDEERQDGENRLDGFSGPAVTDI